MDKIDTRAIIEIAGFPKEHIEGTMVKVVEKLKQDFKVSKQEVYEAVALKDKMEGFWSTFCEVELSFKNVNELIIFCFEYMPSSIEILSPEEIKFKGNEVNSIFNDLLSRLHQYDMIVKNLTASNEIMKKKLNKPSA